MIGTEVYRDNHNGTREYGIIVDERWSEEPDGYSHTSVFGSYLVKLENGTKKWWNWGSGIRRASNGSLC